MSKHKHLLNIIEKYNVFLYSKLNKSNCNIENFFIKHNISNNVLIQNKLNSNELSEEEINKNIKFISDKYVKESNNDLLK